MSRVSLHAVAGLLVALSGCTSSWSVLTDSLERVVLSVNGTADEVVLVGGGLSNGASPLVERYRSGAWQTLPAPGAQTLWWAGRAGAEVFAVGEGGAAFRVGATDVQPLPTPTTATLFGVWGASADEVWAVGGSPQGNGPNDVLLRFDGQSWAQVPSPEPLGVAYFKVWGSARDDVFVVGQQGVILHYDGVAWARMASPTHTTLLTVTGRSSSEVYAVGGPPAVLLRFDGVTWAEQPVPFTASGLTGASMAADGTLWVVGLAGVKWRRPAGGAFVDSSEAAPLGDLHATWAGPSGEAWAVGGNYLALSPTTVRRGTVAYYGRGKPSAP